MLRNFGVLYRNVYPPYPDKMWLSLKYLVNVTLVMTFVSGKPLKKGLNNAIDFGSQVIANPQVQSMLYGNTNLGSLSWGQITQLYRSLTYQVDVVEEG